MEFGFEGTALFALYSSRDISKTVGYPIIPKEVLFTTLYSFPEMPMYKYFISKGVKEKDIEEKRALLLNEMIRGKKSYATIPLTISMVPGKQDLFIIDQDIMKLIILASKIAFEQYGSKHLGVQHLTAATAEMFPEEFEKIIKTFIPSYGQAKSLNELNYLGGDETMNFELPRELASFLTVLNSKYSKDSKECHICGRDEETKSLIKILMKKTKRNAVLVGEPGVGKTALVEKFTWMIVTGNCPEQFKESIVVSLDVNSIVAGTQFRGSAEERFKNLISFLESNPNYILFVDEIHLLLGAGACREGDLDLANALKPLLARGETRVIGATTMDEYRKYFSKDGALKRRFEKIDVREPRSYEVYDMIKNQIKLLEEAHNTTISRELVEAVIFKASCFNFETKNPDRTLDLLDKTMVCAELEGRKEVIEQDILDNFNVNQKKFEKMTTNSKLALAYHEAGHYIVNRFSDEIIEYVMLAVSIIPAEDYLGVNVFDIDSDMTPSRNRRYYIQRIGAILAGRVAERMYSHTLTAGASSDLLKATQIAKDVVTRYGLAEELSEDRVFIKEGPNDLYNEKIITDINSHMDKILKEARVYTENLLVSKQKYLDALANALVEKGMLSNSEIDELFKGIE